MHVNGGHARVPKQMKNFLVSATDEDPVGLLSQQALHTFETLARIVERPRSVGARKSSYAPQAVLGEAAQCVECDTYMHAFRIASFPVFGHGLARESTDVLSRNAKFCPQEGMAAVPLSL